MEKQVQLIVVSGQEAGRIFVISGEGAVIGRSKTADIALNDEALSRQHCRIFFTSEPMVQDLISSNGTLLNDVAVREQPLPLHEGDTLTIGSWVLRVAQITGLAQSQATVTPVTPEKTQLFESADAPIEEKQTDPVSERPELFKAEKPSEKEESSPAAKKKLWLIIALCLVLFCSLAGGLLFMEGTEKPKAPAVRQLARTSQLAEFHYERLVVDAQHLFSYTLTYDATTNLLMVDVTDLGEADRSFSKVTELSKDAKATLMKMLWEVDVSKIGEIFPERSPDGISLERRKLTLVRGTEVWQRTAENVTHLIFNGICETLEFFASNELQVWAAQYSVAELEALAEEQLAVAERYWEQRDLGDDKLWAAVTAYKKGLSALETLNPKPETIKPLTAGLTQAEALLAERYEATLFEVDQALNTQRYEVAIQQLQKILRLIPDRDDRRHQQASEKLLTVEQRRGMKGGR